MNGEVWWNRVHLGSCESMSAIPNDSVHCVVTSPPYFGLRDYGTGTWVDGDAACDHKRATSDKTAASTLVASAPNANHALEGWRGGVCGKCGATKVDDQIGLEPTIDAYVARIVSVSREIWRVLRPDGTFWLNLGDSYAANRSYEVPQTMRGNAETDVPYVPRRISSGLKPKDLMLVPARVALALQADGWWLRDEIVWAKPNPMPSSVDDRCTPSHEKLYMLAKRARYFADMDAVRQPMSEVSLNRLQQPNFHAQTGGEKDYRTLGISENMSIRKTAENLRQRLDESPLPTLEEMLQSERPQMRRAAELAKASGLTQAHFDAIRASGAQDASYAQHAHSGLEFKRGLEHKTSEVRRLAHEAKAVLGGYFREFLLRTSLGANMRNVWTIPTVPYAQAHFATFPPELPERCIKIGTSEGGCCAECGAPRIRMISREVLDQRASDADERYVEASGGHSRSRHPSTVFAQSLSTRRTTAGWEASCQHDADTVPCVVLDPFLGSGTVADVALRLGRRWVGYELNPAYVELINGREAVAEHRAYDAALSGETDGVAVSVSVQDLPLFAGEAIA